MSNFEFLQLFAGSKDYRNQQLILYGSFHCCWDASWAVRSLPKGSPGGEQPKHPSPHLLATHLPLLEEAGQEVVFPGPEGQEVDQQQHTERVILRIKAWEQGKETNSVTQQLRELP